MGIETVRGFLFLLDAENQMQKRTVDVGARAGLRLQFFRKFTEAAEHIALLHDRLREVRIQIRKARENGRIVDLPETVGQKERIILLRRHSVSSDVAFQDFKRRLRNCQLNSRHPVAEGKGTADGGGGRQGAHRIGIQMAAAAALQGDRRDGGTLRFQSLQIFNAENIVGA